MDDIKTPVNEIINTNTPVVPVVAKKPLLSPLTQIDMQLGFLIGTIVGIIGADICILVFIEMAFIFKVFVVIGALGILGSLSLGLFQTVNMRKQYLASQNQAKQFKDMFAASQSKVSDPGYVG